MKTFLFQVLIANASLILVYFLYKLLLARTTFYKANRWFLWAGILVSCLAPFVRLAVLPAPKPILLPVVLSDATTVADTAGTMPVWSLESYLYNGLFLVLMAGILFFIGRSVIRLWSVYRLHRQSMPAQKEGLAYRELKPGIAPFSFGRYIYLNSDSYTAEQLEAIICHEQVHVRERHTLDILLMELLQALFWYNPCLPGLKRAVSQNLEYIADEQVVNLTANKAQYQYSLLHVSTGNRYIHLTNSFNLQNLKNRITMMNQSKTPKAQWYRYVLAMPLIIAAGFSFSLTHAQEQVILIKSKASTGTVTNTNKESTPERPVTVKVVNDAPAVQRKEIAVVKVEGPAKLQAAKDALDVQDADYKDAAVKVYMDDKSDQVTVVAKNGTLSAQKITVTNVSDNHTKDESKHEIKIKSGLNKAILIIVNGKEQTDMSLTDLNPNDIKTMSVYKDPETIKKYGEKAKDGVVVIETK